MRFVGRKASKGSVLPFVIVLAATSAVILLPLVSSMTTRATIMADRQGALDAGRVVRGLTGSIMADAVSKTRSGTPVRPSPRLDYTDSLWRLSSWQLTHEASADFLTSPSNLDTGSDRDRGEPGSLVWDSPLSFAQPIGGVATLTYAAPDTAAIDRPETLVVTAHKVPVGALQLVTYSEPLAATPSVTIDGSAFLAAGVTGSPDVTVNGGRTYFPRTQSVGGVNSAMRPTRHRGPVAMPAITPASLSAIFEADVTFHTVISDSDNPPAPLLSSYTHGGQIIPALELGRYGGSGTVVIEMAGVAGSRGVALIGSASETQVPLTVVIKGGGPVYLVGNNSRAITLCTTAPVTLVSTVSAGGVFPSAAQAQDTFWKGYLCLPTSPLTLGTVESWAGNTYAIQGGLSFIGGAIHSGSLRRLSISAPVGAALEDFRALFAPPCRYDSMAVFQPR